MEHNKINNRPWNFDMNIIDVLEEYVITLSKEKWKNDKCPPKFIVSLNNEDMENQSIMITIDHLGSKFTEKLFPRYETHYGYDSILNQMINMYNQTMQKENFMYLLIYFRYNLEICDYIIDYQKFESLKQMELWIKEMKDINKNDFQVIYKYKIEKEID